MSTAPAITLGDRVAPVRRLSLIVGAAALAVTLLAALVLPRSALPAYLVAYLFWAGIALGCLSLTMLHHLVGGQWGLPVRRPLEAGALTIVPLALLFLPIALGMRALYRWTDPVYAEAHEAVQVKIAYLNTSAFLLRTVGFFLVWGVLAYLFGRWSLDQDASSDDAPKRRMEGLAGPGLGLLFLTGTFATIDWIMSLEPDWYSTIYSTMVIVGWGLLTFAMAILCVSWLARSEPMASTLTPTRLHDLGNLMLAFTMLWAYMSFAQFLIIWCGNTAEETPWYIRRTHGGWQVVAASLILFHFFAPFFFLLFRENKRRPDTLKYGAALIAVMHAVDLTWLVLPAGYEDPRHVAIPWVSLLLVPVAIAGVGGLWVWTFLHFLTTRPLLIRHVPETVPDPHPEPSIH